MTVGGDIWWGKDESWLKCIDASGVGDITATNLVWSYPLGPHCCSTPSISEGLVYVADCGGAVHCVDAATGKACWVHQAGGDIWASTLVADGKVYIGTAAGRLLGPCRGQGGSRDRFRPVGRAGSRHGYGRRRRALRGQHGAALCHRKVIVPASILAQVRRTKIETVPLNDYSEAKWLSHEKHCVGVGF